MSDIKDDLHQMKVERIIRRQKYLTQLQEEFDEINITPNVVSLVDKNNSRQSILNGISNQGFEKFKIPFLLLKFGFLVSLVILISEVIYYENLLFTTSIIFLIALIFFTACSGFFIHFFENGVGYWRLSIKFNSNLRAHLFWTFIGANSSKEQETILD